MVFDCIAVFLPFMRMHGEYRASSSDNILLGVDLTNRVGISCVFCYDTL